jgi:hypothetical protein
MLVLPGKQLPLFGFVLCVLCAAVQGWSSSNCRPFSTTKALGSRSSGAAHMRMHLSHTSHRQISPYGNVAAVQMMHAKSGGVVD